MENKKKCAWCGIEFRQKKAAQKYCSTWCAQEAVKDQAAKRAKDAKANKLWELRGGELRTCLACGCKFLAQEGCGWHCSPKCCESTLAYHAQINAKQKGV